MSTESSQESASPRNVSPIDRESIQSARETLRSLSEILTENSTLPVGISSIRVAGAYNTRAGFLQKALQSCVDPSAKTIKSRPLLDTLNNIQETTGKLMAFGIYESANIKIDRASSAVSGENDLDVIIQVKEKPRLFFETGTDVGNVEGNVHANVLARNLFGGAEFLSGNVSYGTRNRATMSAKFETPVNASPATRLRVLGYSNVRDNKAISSHELITRGLSVSLQHQDRFHGLHELSQNFFWRQVTRLSEFASPSIRLQAGDTIKQSLAYSYVMDTRDHPTLPSRGNYVRALMELAGLGPVTGDARFLKSELWHQYAVSLNRAQSVTLAVSSRLGAIKPLDESPILLCDRFTLGGSTSLRGFSEDRLGPKDGKDSLGGSAYLALSTSLLFPLPKLDASKPFRMQVFANAGGLTNLDARNPLNTYKSIMMRPCVSTGLGLVYASPAARFELNFTIPIAVTGGDVGRKGLQLGAGIEFM
ncbi:SAM complex subunit Sam50 [Schizosaccharomyces octosporus yFS286]|uniref:SAM complex subunit Sam50 n=1 Tax=Schizosaccharomyces octosporus (strain yFS286) TaxID=483514 RepID=S9PVD2_SCHOY|nr:SAM complex subunit Sam50 [Schizosaccharomyces octosporus yFS286]EPX73056.1 SAM complex subunit Sam50 [Schizosaccharomyces octosporus yFS286]